MKMIEKLIEEIEQHADEIKSVNSDNIQELFEYYRIDRDASAEQIVEELRECDIEATEFAIQLIKKYNISLYSPIQYVEVDESVLNLLKSKSLDEFVERLEEYADFIESWRDSEVQAAKELIDDEILRNMPSDVLYVAVAYKYWYGDVSRAGHSFVSRVYYTDDAQTKEELEEKLDKENVEYDEILTIDELKSKLFSDYQYREQLGGGAWGAPETEYIFI